MELIIVLIVILAVVFISDEEIMKSAAFQQTLQRAKDTMKWMTFAGGTDPILPPLIKKPFDQPYNIIFEKQGYDLWTEHYKQYVNGTVWEDREKGLNEFYNDLFKEHAEALKELEIYMYRRWVVKTDLSRT